MPFANDGGGGGARCGLAFVLGVLAALPPLKRSRIEPADAEVVGLLLLLLLEVGCGRRVVSVLCGGGTGTYVRERPPTAHISSAAERLRV